MKHILFILVLFFLPLFANAELIVKLDIKENIGPASSSYLKEGVAYAQSKNAHIILIELDTPGGLFTSTREMIKEILNSPIPIITYVSPRGAHAASAGTYLLYASHIAAMSPGTNLGAATPVSIFSPPDIADSNTTQNVLEKKAINDATAYIQSLAQLNDRNISWAVEAVKEAKSISAQDALRHGVINLIASNKKELLSKLDGKIVTVAGDSITLKTKNAVIENFEADWKTRFLSTVTNPNIAYIFILMAMYGIFFEMMNPGSIFPGVIGMISGVIALYALNMIPFNYAGLMLIMLGVSFMIAEIFVAGFGILGIGGVLAFAFGSVILFDAETLGSGVSIPVIIAFTIVSLAFFILVMKLFINSRSAKVVSGAEEMIGAVAEVLEISKKAYKVRCHGETWSALSTSRLEVGQKVQVEELLGLTLKVKPIEE